MKASQHKTTPAQDAVAEAVQIVSQIEDLTERLNELKDIIRNEALPAIPRGANNTYVETSVGRCQVCIVKDQLVLTKGTDPMVLKASLPRQTWKTFFIMKPVIRRTAADAWAAMSMKARSRLGEHSPFALRPRLAQVKLPRLPKLTDE